jgi:ABC-type multidrug transport system ATPase subunit
MRQIEITNVSKSFGTKNILNQVSLQCKTGDVIGLFGRNGTGKSTLLKIVFGTLKADSISIIYDGEQICVKKIIPSKLIGYLPQESFLPKQLKVRDIIPMFFERSDEQDLVFYAPKIRSFDYKKVGELSLGQRRYLEVLLVGNLEHPFLFLDEPFSMIEPLYKVEIKKLLTKLSKYKGIIITDHYYNDVLDITNKNFLLKDAVLHEINSKEELIEMKYLTKQSEI